MSTFAMLTSIQVIAASTCVMPMSTQVRVGIYMGNSYICTKYAYIYINDAYHYMRDAFIFMMLHIHE